jgi:hypothetical protein
MLITGRNNLTTRKKYSGGKALLIKRGLAGIDHHGIKLFHHGVYRR